MKEIYKEFINIDGDYINVNQIKFIKDNGHNTWIVMGELDDELNNVIVTANYIPQEIYQMIVGAKDLAKPKRMPKTKEEDLIKDPVDFNVPKPVKKVVRSLDILNNYK